MIRERFTERSGVRIRFLDNEPAEPVGLPVLFSPGVTDFADEYRETLEFFGSRRLLVVEVRGRGGSEAPPTGYHASDQRRDLEAVLDEAGINRFHLMTFSRGTTWGLDVAFARSTKVVSISIGDYAAREIGLNRTAADFMLATRFRGRQMPERVQPHVLPELFAASENRDLHAPLAALGVPVLVATGSEPGCMLTPEDLAHFRATIPAAALITIPNASHDLFRPDRHAYPRAVVHHIAAAESKIEHTNLLNKRSDVR